jgi:hypothetical protein
MEGTYHTRSGFAAQKPPIQMQMKENFNRNAFERKLAAAP